MDWCPPPCQAAASKLRVALRAVQAIGDEIRDICLGSLIQKDQIFFIPACNAPSPYRLSSKQETKKRQVTPRTTN